MNIYSGLTDEQLQNEFNAIYEERERRRKIKELNEANTLSINGITCKDIAVRYHGYDGSTWPVDDADIRFSFFVKHDGKLYNIYYDHSVYDFTDGRKQTFHPWWPILPLEDGETEYDDWEHNGAYQFIPSGFSEACENSYEYRGTFKQALETLQKHGITDIEKGDW